MDAFFRVVVYATFWFIGIAVGVSALSIAYNELMTPRQVASPGGMVMPTIPFPATMLLAEGLALHLDGQHERAIRTLRQSLKRSQNAVVHARLAAVYADIGRIDEAEEEIKLILEKNPDAMVEDFLRNFQDPKRAEWYAGLLKESGLPE
jgi:tetratricopeptide (TPR) repeat protein